ncbi:MAG TPA: hypothetical protein VIH57_22400 [Bacteroidales bacterium]
MKVNIVINFSRYSDDELATVSLQIVDSMTENSNFPNPVPSIGQVETSLSEFVTALTACADRAKSATLNKKMKRATLEGLLKDLGAYVQSNCHNDLNIALSSGFRTRKEKTRHGILPKPEYFKVEPGPIPGSLKLSVGRVMGASTYLFQWALVPVDSQTKWEFQLGKTRMIIKGLIQGKEYAFRVAAKGAADELVFSDIITHFVA